MLNVGSGSRVGAGIGAHGWSVCCFVPAKLLLVLLMLLMVCLLMLLAPPLSMCFGLFCLGLI